MLKFTVEALVREINELKRKPSDVSAEEEARYLVDLWANSPVLAQRFDLYDQGRIAGLGGTSILLRATYLPSGNQRAIKIPRKRQFEAGLRTPEAERDRAKLEKISHQNIAAFHDSFALPNSGSYGMVSDFVSGDDNSLDAYVIRLFCNDECRRSSERLNHNLKVFARTIYQLSGALLHLHENAKLLHCDVKPDNLLISADGVPFVVDLSSTRGLEGHDKTKTIEIGFTWKYAHPKLVDISTGGARVKKPLMSSDLRVRPKTSSWITEFSQHEADRCEFQEREGVAVEIFPVLGEAAAAVEPGNGAFDNPALG